MPPTRTTVRKRSIQAFNVNTAGCVGLVIKEAVKLGRQTRPDLEIGICGEHGGEPSSVEFCYQIGMNYVSCSPYRVPIARLAAAQAALSAKGGKSEANRTA
ncbi:hypothetical protein F183_A52680 [Bryobacterales bacterium F-183]|nr:hypothetical protein F183_A52680 [Bryobacterales bacterium F-183]